MKYENYIFSGFGYSHGKYKITNQDISDAIDKGFLQGFSNEKIQKSAKYLEFKKSNPNSSPFDYFAGHIMGFYERHHVTPFPPTTKKLYYAETSLELCIKAVESALTDAQLQAGDIDAWYVSTVSPHEQAPGIAATVKSYFVPFSDKRPAFTLASGCAGFNMNLETAIGYFKSNSNAKHILIAHTETMSSFLTQRTKFVPFVTFGDAAAAVIVSRFVDDEKYGLIDILNLHDLNMLDYVGVDHKRNLYMDDALIKDRATINLPYAAEKCMAQSSWNKNDIDWLVPHQTGNVILLPTAESLGIPKSKVFLGGQNNYGNVSGATVPLSLAMMSQNDMLTNNTRILSATAGVGGNFGAFTYIHKNIKPQNSDYYLHKNELAGKNALILGASGTIGMELANEMQKRGANLWLQACKNSDLLQNFNGKTVFTCDFTDSNSVEAFIDKIKGQNLVFDYVINLAGTTDKNSCLDVNFKAPARIINAILPLIKETIVNLGTAAEDAELSDADQWISSNRAFHGYLASASGEFFKNGLRTVYLQSGFGDNGISEKFNDKYLFKFMLLAGQASRLKIELISNNIINSLYLPKVLGVKYSYENAMLLGRMGYTLEVDI